MTQLQVETLHSLILYKLCMVLVCKQSWILNKKCTVYTILKWSPHGCITADWYFNTRHVWFLDWLVGWLVHLQFSTSNSFCFSMKTYEDVWVKCKVVHLHQLGILTQFTFNTFKDLWNKTKILEKQNHISHSSYTFHLSTTYVVKTAVTKKSGHATYK